MGRLTILVSKLATLVLPVIALAVVLAGRSECRLLAGAVIMLPYALLALSTVESRDRLTVLAAVAVYLEVAVLVYLKIG